MAEFKLGRIRFVWKGDWAPLSSYYKDDIIRNGANTYVCIKGHTSPALFTADQNEYWNKVSDGVEWKGDWSLSTYYKVSDIVKYGGYLYICNTAHTSVNNVEDGLEVDAGSDSTTSKWDLFAEGFDYKADWLPNNRYKVNDVVKYNGTVYICTEEHVSGSVNEGIEQDLVLNSQGETIAGSRWNIFSEGFYWREDWEINTRYKKNDVVRYGGSIYVCNVGHNSAATVAIGLEADLVTDGAGTLLAGSKWDYLHRGIEFLGNWNSTTVRYKRNDVVKYGGGIWICVTPHNPQSTFTADESKWNQFVEGLEFEDSWNPLENYQPGDFVTYGGYSYVSKTNHTASKPSESTTNWSLFTTGFNWRGDYDDDADSSGTDYRVGDVVRLGGYTYLCIEDHLYDDELALNPSYTGYRPSTFDNTAYWVRLNSGIEWKNAWSNADYYDEGDAVSYGVNSYICIKPHTSDQIVDQNRPDQDVTGEFWNILSGGPESGNLTTLGDIVYYGGAGPTRLPVGQPGQVLRVNNAGNAPEWAYLGAINNVYYVAETGIDAPAPSYGTTLDRPFRTVRYAAEQIEKGALNPASTRLLELNKAFIQAEIVEWVDYQVTNNIAPFTSGFTYDKALCKRDMGILVDAIIHDLRKGGNVKSRAAALAYFDGATSYITGQEGETVAAISYGIDVIDAVLTNFDPAQNYQTLNSVVGPITQFKDVSLVEETTAQATIESLLGIVTSAITAGNTNSVPVQLKINNSIFVKTGRYLEVLPIVVPELTAIIGDELRSTRIEPAGSLISSTDVPYSIAGINNLGSNISALLSGDNDGSGLSDGLSSFSSEILNTSVTVADSAVAADAANLAQQIADYISWGENGPVGDSTTPAMTGSNTPNTAEEYTKAVEVIEKNRTYLVEEVIGFIAATYPGYVYDESKCRRDVNRYIDAIKYDLIYTGNYKSLRAAQHYVNALNGSIEQDMFYMRNGTGLRNCTVQGLTGILGTPNIYGTSRPTAGAFVSLDPGWGPTHTDAWILNKSPYVQNVTTFGTGCIGLKVDGALHDGGNDSIVANDFTQILSDGIGYWVTNLGRSELVSVFTYYNHIGYLAENGGKIRATNGNNSYGDYGSVAEGVDVTETPVVGIVDNQAFDAVVYNVITNGTQILTFEFLNAGQDYTTSTTAIKTITDVGPVDFNRVSGTYNNVSGTSNGSGTGQEFTVDITDTGVAQLTLTKGGTGHVIGDIITIPASAVGGAGLNITAEVATVGNATEWTVTGEGFNAAISASNVVDGGVFEVRLLETDVNLDSTLDFGGAGYLDATNVGQGGTNTSITISNTDVRIGSQYLGMAVFITAGKGAGQYAKISSYNSGTKIANVIKFSDGTAGWDHVVPGTAIETLLDDTTVYSIEPAIVFAAPPSGLYADTAKGRAYVEDGKIVRITIFDPGQGYVTAPVLTIVDPNNTIEVPHTVRIADGVLTQPTWSNRGVAMATAQAEVVGDGYMDRYQNGVYIKVKNLSSIPKPGSNIEFDGLPGSFFKLVSVTQLTGLGPYAARLQVSPEMSITDAPEHLEGVTLRIRYSQVRLTGHDFLDIGTGNFGETNYPGIPIQLPIPERETNDFGGGRVFYTSTDQDGNFRVGELFSVEQSTGIATLNADAFNISGLQELQLGNLELGGTGASINEFSTDGTFTANSDNIVPTQKAIRTYIQSQIGGGAGELNVNSITAGVIQISTNEITTITGVPINALQKINFQKGIDGHPLAMNFYLNQ